MTVRMPHSFSRFLKPSAVGWALRYRLSPMLCRLGTPSSTMGCAQFAGRPAAVLEGMQRGCSHGAPDIGRRTVAAASGRAIFRDAADMSARRDGSASGRASLNSRVAASGALMAAPASSR
jgi:hypothetical protein